MWRSMRYRAVKYKKKGHVSYVSLDPALSTVSTQRLMCTELTDFCDVVSQDDSVNAVVIKISGETVKLRPSKRRYAAIYEAIDAVAHLDKIVIAVIDGDAIGEYLELALACDIRIATDRSRFALPEVAKGTIPSGGGTQRLPRLIGQAKALEMILTADMIDADEALRIGLVHKIFPFKEVGEKSELLVNKIAEQAPIALRFCKEAVYKGMDLAFEQGLRMEADLYFLIQTTSDRMDGIRAFLEKRPPAFKGK